MFQLEGSTFSPETEEWTAYDQPTALALSRSENQEGARVGWGTKCTCEAGGQMTDLVKQLSDDECGHSECRRAKRAAADHIEQLESEITNLAGDILMVKVLRERIATLEFIVAKHQSQGPLENSESPSLNTLHGQE